MKKILGVVVFGGLALVLALVVISRAQAAGAAGAAPVSPDRAACVQLADLCTTATQKIDVDACEKSLADTRKLAGASGVEKTEACIGESRSCAAASGCMGGGIGVSALGEALKGFGSALSR